MAKLPRPWRDAATHQREIAGSELALFDDLGHAPEEEEGPARTVEAVKRFLGAGGGLQKL